MTADYLGEAIEVAVHNVKTGGGPFGALLVTPEGDAYPAGNRVTANNDPTAHAEVMAIRAACADRGTFDLSGCTLYSSCEPCPMCATAARWARVERVVYAADRHAAAAAGFDDSVFYDAIAEPDGLILGAEHAERLAPFETWASAAARTPY